MQHLVTFSNTCRQLVEEKKIQNLSLKSVFTIPKSRTRIHQAIKKKLHKIPQGTI